MVNLLVWAGLWLGLFCVLEALAVWWPGCPWDTFSRFIWDAQTIWKPLTIGIVFVLGILLAHLPRYKNVAEGDRNETGK